MYSYYALKALKFRVPRWIAMSITTAQLAQMVMGAVVNIWAYQVKQAGNECHVSYDNIKISLLMYTSYFVLFARFFRKAYVVNKQAGSQPPKMGQESLAYEGKSSKGKLEWISIFTGIYRDGKTLIIDLSNTWVPLMANSLLVSCTCFS